MAVQETVFHSRRSIPRRLSSRSTAETVTYVCSLDGQQGSSSAPGLPRLGRLTNGPHDIRMWGTDEAGNTSAAAFHLLTQVDPSDGAVGVVEA